MKYYNLWLDVESLEKNNLALYQYNPQTKKFERVDYGYDSLIVADKIAGSLTEDEVYNALKVSPVEAHRKLFEKIITSF